MRVQGQTSMHPEQAQLDLIPSQSKTGTNNFGIGQAEKELQQKQNAMEKEMAELRDQEGSSPSVVKGNASRINGVGGASQSKTPSVISHASSSDPTLPQPLQKLWATPSIESRQDPKSSTFESAELFSGARPIHYTSNQGTMEKKVKFNPASAESHSQLEEDPLSQQKPFSNPSFASPQANHYSHLPQTTSSQKESGQGSGRERRQCREKTSKYSLTHKGMLTNINQTTTDDRTKNLNSNHSYRHSREWKYRFNSKHSGVYSTFSVPQTELERLESAEFAVKEREAAQLSKPQKKSSHKSPEECLRSIRDMLAFDWNLKDIANLRHSPQQEFSNSIFWFYVSTLYFPFGGLEQSKLPEDEFLKTILLNLLPNNNKNQIQEELKRNPLADSDTPLRIQNFDEQLLEAQRMCGNEQSNIEDEVPQCVKSLFRDKRLRKFKLFLKDLQDRAVQETFKEPSDQIAIPDSPMKKAGDDYTQEQQDERKYQIMLELLKREVEQLETQNRTQISLQYQKFRHAYNIAFEDEGEPDPFPYRADETDKYSLAFQAKIEPRFVKDYEANMEWYKENYNAIMLNVCQPSKLEKDFLKHIEQEQQRKSDIKYKKILKQIEQGRKSGQILQDEEKANSGGSNMRTIQAQDDAQCAICNNGDYEDEDMIVFCGNCNIPVHQSCYGIEQLPEGDWVCYNCEIFGFKRGLMVNCLLCPKKGGAMKATNIFTSAENYRLYNNSSNGSQAKRSSKKSTHAYQSFQSEKLPPSEELDVDHSHHHHSRFLVGDIEDKNLSLSVILMREFNYQSKLRENSLKANFPLENLELQFDQHEKETMTPDDYQCFISKNEAKIEAHHPTQTLYQWVHLSCASWIPGPLVTPKTPVRMSKFDEKRFNLQCIICLKKDGACMQCQAPRCTIAFHVECARRSNYCMELEKRDRDKTYRMFCEKHRPLKIVKEMEERDRHTVEEIQKFCKIIEKCMEIDYRHQLKPSKHQERMEKEALASSKNGTKSSSKKVKERTKKEGGHREREKVKKWRERDKKLLFEQVKEKYLMFRKMRINLARVDPSRKAKKPSKSQAKKRNKKRDDKKLAHTGGSRAGLRSAYPQSDMGEEVKGQDDFVMEEEKNEEIQDSTNQQVDQSEIVEITLNINPEEEDQDIYYKMCIPLHPTELDWTITLSRNDFPWNEIKFGIFTARDCYEKYSSIVRDAQTFLKKVLGLKEKYKKMMHNQIQMGVSVGSSVPQTVNENQLYCRCKGEVFSEIYVKCDGDQECPNSGWLHPQCTTDLRHLPKQQLDDIDEWYCEDCVARIKKEDEDDAKGIIHDQEEEEDQAMEDIGEEEGLKQDGSQHKGGEESSDDESSSSEDDSSFGGMKQLSQNQDQQHQE